MALTAERREEYARSAFSIINAARGNIRPGPVALRIIERVGERDLGNQNAIVTIATQQLRAYTAGAELQALGAGASRVPPVIDDTLLFSPDRFGWKVLVVSRNPLTGERVVQLKEITSNDTLTTTAIIGRAESAFQNDPTRGGRYPEMARMGQGTVTDFYIVSEGRRR